MIPGLGDGNEKIESHMTFYLESKNQSPIQVRRGGVLRVSNCAIGKKAVFIAAKYSLFRPLNDHLFPGKYFSAISAILWLK